MKKFTVPCTFGSEDIKSPFNIYIGSAGPKRHPLYYQTMWLKEVRGGTVPTEVMDAFQKLRDIALENDVSFEDLCVTALGTVQTKEGPPDK